MAAPKGGKRPAARKPGRAPAPRPGKPRRAGPPHPPGGAPFEPATGFDEGFRTAARPYRPAPEYPGESVAGLRHEIADLRAEVHRLAAEIDKLWARERGRGMPTPGRTARSIAGKPARTGSRSARPAPRRDSDASRAADARRAPGARSKSPPGSLAGAPAKRTTPKRGAAWAKPKSRSRRSGTTPRRKGR